MNAPNVLPIHCHDLGQYVGCYGVDIEMPNLERLADEDARFANHGTTAPQCSVDSVASTASVRTAGDIGD